MSLARTLPKLLVLATACVAAACTTSTEETAGDEGAFTSNDANILELSFDGAVVGKKGESARKVIATQLMYLQGQLTSNAGGNAQAGMPKLEILEERRDGRKNHIRYSAKVAAAWPKYGPPPTSYDVVLPLDMTAIDDFNRRYDGTCGTTHYGQDTFWHDWNPRLSTCNAAPGDVHRVTATIRRHPDVTQGKYPEYRKIWEDGSLDIVAVFGIISSNTPSDEGVRTREQLLDVVKSSLQDGVRKEAPATRGILKESNVSGKLVIDGAERRVSLTAMLVQSAETAGTAFENRYAALTEKADVVIYEGHSGLGKNIAVLSSKMGAKAGKYQLVYLYGCQTLGYLGPEMHQKRIDLNGAANDPDGTKFLDVIATALPAQGDNGRSTTALYRAMIDPGHPKTFNDLLDTISTRHLAVVFGEHDNTFEP